MSRNLTVQLDEEVVREAKVLAARRGTSVSALVAKQIAKLTGDQQRYERARERALRALDEASDQGGVVEPYTRDDLHTRRPH